MSDDDELYGRPGNEAAQGLSPMPPVIPREDEEVKTYDSDKDGLESAARDLSKSRGEEREPLVDRAYTYYQGPQAGEKVEDSKTLTPERAAADLAQARWLEVQAIEDAENRQMADAVDSAKGVATESEVAEWVAQQQQAQEQAAQQSAPQTDVPPGMDEDVYRALSNPKVQQALQAEIAQTEQARKAYSEGAFRSAQIAAASLVASVPELQGIEPAQMNVALQLIEKQSPEKAQAIRQHLGKIEYLFNVAQQAKAEQAKLEQHRTQQQLQAWQQSESQKWDAFAAKPENAQRVKAVMPEAVALFSEYGIGRQELQQLLRTQPLLQSAVGQQIVLDALSYRQAQKTALQNPARAPLPPVQKPGVASYRSASDGDVESARSEFLSNPNPRSAARMIAARRRAS